MAEPSGPVAERDIYGAVGEAVNDRLVGFVEASSDMASARCAERIMVLRAKLSRSKGMSSVVSASYVVKSQLVVTSDSDN